MTFKVLFTSTILSILLISCEENVEQNTPVSKSVISEEKNRDLSEAFKAYWYDGTAEITSYQLTQERYGELRDGKAVTIFVTEDFLPEAQVKANQKNETTISVLKLNQTKNYITGIYPYSVMTSVFSPVNTEGHPLKITHSVQEWCGQAYVQLNNREQYIITQHSYFEGEEDQNFTMEKSWLEDELWNLIRLNPKELPEGTIGVIPSFESSRMTHNPLKIENAVGKITKNDTLSTYTLSFTESKRSISINFNDRFPFEIESWKETHANGLITEAKKLKTIKTNYWNKNKVINESLRDSLLLN